MMRRISQKNQTVAKRRAGKAEPPDGDPLGDYSCKCQCHREKVAPKESDPEKAMIVERNLASMILVPRLANMAFLSETTGVRITVEAENQQQGPRRTVLKGSDTVLRKTKHLLAMIMATTFVQRQQELLEQQKAAKVREKEQQREQQLGQEKPQQQEKQKEANLGKGSAAGTQLRGRGRGRSAHSRRLPMGRRGRRRIGSPARTGGRGWRCTGSRTTLRGGG